VGGHSLEVAESARAHKIVDSEYESEGEMEPEKPEEPEPTEPEKTTEPKKTTEPEKTTEPPFVWEEREGKRVRVLVAAVRPESAVYEPIDALIARGEVVCSPRSEAWARARLAIEDGEVETVTSAPLTRPTTDAEKARDASAVQMTLHGTPAPGARASPSTPHPSIWGEFERTEFVDSGEEYSWLAESDEESGANDPVAEPEAETWEAAAAKATAEAAQRLLDVARETEADQVARAGMRDLPESTRASRPFLSL
jgi:hypothetical protein